MQGWIQMLLGSFSKWLWRGKQALSPSIFIPGRPNWGIPTCPHLKALRPPHQRTHLKGETAWHQPGSKPAQRGHLDPRKDLPSCHGWWEGEQMLGRAAQGWGQVGTGREEGRWLPHPVLLHLTSTTGGREGYLGLYT